MGEYRALGVPRAPAGVHYDGGVARARGIELATVPFSPHTLPVPLHVIQPFKPDAAVLDVDPADDDDVGDGGEAIQDGDQAGQEVLGHDHGAGRDLGEVGRECRVELWKVPIR